MISEFHGNYWTSSIYVAATGDVNLISVVDEAVNAAQMLSVKSGAIADYEDCLKFIEMLNPETKALENREFFRMFGQYKGDGSHDFTGIAKGAAIQYMINLLTDDSIGCKSLLIDFGGDIVAINSPKDYEVNIEAANGKQSKVNLAICKGETKSIFTSGNNVRRGNHIKTKVDAAGTLTIIIPTVDPIFADMAATSIYAGTMVPHSTLTRIVLNHAGDEFIITKHEELPRKKADDPKVVQNFYHTYTASPFFCDYDVAVRDQMVEAVKNSFRPDLTESGKLYDSTPVDDVERRKSYTKLILRDNIEGIRSASSLVFPEFTDDLGTLMEIGIALSEEKVVGRYNYLTDSYIFYTYYDKKQLKKLLLKNDEILRFDIDAAPKAVMFGYNVNLTADENLNTNIKYDLVGLPDNIMLSESAHRVAMKGEEVKCSSSGDGAKSEIMEEYNLDSVKLAKVNCKLVSTILGSGAHTKLVTSVS